MHVPHALLQAVYAGDATLDSDGGEGVFSDSGDGDDVWGTPPQEDEDSVLLTTPCSTSKQSISSAHNSAGTGQRH